MTASEAPAPETAGLVTPPLPPLPSIASLIASAYNFLTTPPNASILFGFAGWMFIPLIINLASSYLGQDWKDVFDIASGVALFGLSLWSTAAIIIMIAGIVRPDLTPKDTATSVSELAWRRAPTLFWIGLLVVILQIAGYLLFIVPGVIFSVWFAFAEIEAVLTGSRTFASLAQSRERVSGYFFPVLWRLFALAVILVVISSVVLWPILMLAGLTDLNILLTAPPAWFEALLTGIEILLMPLILTYQMHLYFALRKP